ncbi:MAG: glycosyltransferase [Candidatus Cohnella colombiensis]|uniref:Glycosyltransferase n=1 Tax=Candidatus Cohnella colombiensis TaxID=3121368 RepID=A0AA95JAW0_9BACL|nr:MAG: glycosyltransferase [Cohnella sp.]
MLSQRSRVKTWSTSDQAYHSGWHDGWRLGACRSIDKVMKQTVDVAATPVCQATILYVSQGFEAIDRGIIAALSSQVSQVHVVSYDLIEQQAVLLRPDAVIVLNGLHIFPANQVEQIEAIRRLNILTAIWFVDDPYFTDDTMHIAPHYDYVFTHERACVPLYQSLGCTQVHHLPLATHSELFYPQAVEREYVHDICFIGTGFHNRIQLFDQLAPYLKRKNVVIAGGLWHRMRRYGLIANSIIPEGVRIEEAAKLYNGAKIVINVHRATDHRLERRNSRNWPGQSINPRTFDIGGCGAMQLTDYREELPDFYHVGTEIDVYQNARQLMELLDYYLTNENERTKIAARGYLRTRREHSFTSRVRRLLNTLGFC